MDIYSDAAEHELPLSQEASSRKRRKSHSGRMAVAVIAVAAAAVLTVCLLLAVGNLRSAEDKADEAGTAASQLPEDETDSDHSDSAAAALDPTLGDLAVDEAYWAAGEDAEATFTVYAGNAADEILLYETDGPIGRMYDDGTNGDETAGDGIYTLQINIMQDEAGRRDYHAESGDTASESISVWFFSKPEESDVLLLEESIDELDALRAGYEDENGVVAEEDSAALMAQVGEYLDELLDENVIVLYETEEDTAYIKFASGVTVMFDGVVEEDSLGDGTDVTLTYLTCQPHKDLIEAYDMRDIEEVVESTLDLGVSSYTGEEVTLDVVRSFTSNQAVMWYGHGGYGAIVQSYLATGNSFDYNSWLIGGEYWLDCVRDRVLNREGYECFTSKFIDYYCGDLSNDLFFLTSCHSGQSEKLAQAFLNKGATAVVGFSRAVLTVYGYRIGAVTMAYMTEKNPDTDSYYTLSEALGIARDLFGNSDVEYAESVGKDVNKKAAEAVIFGGIAAEEYRLAEWQEAEEVEASGPADQYLQKALEYEQAGERNAAVHTLWEAREYWEDSTELYEAYQRLLVPVESIVSYDENGSRMFTIGFEWDEEQRLTLATNYLPTGEAYRFTSYEYDRSLNTTTLTTWFSDSYFDMYPERAEALATAVSTEEGANGEGNLEAVQGGVSDDDYSTSVEACPYVQVVDEEKLTREEVLSNGFPKIYGSWDYIEVTYDDRGLVTRMDFYKSNGVSTGYALINYIQ